MLKSILLTLNIFALVSLKFIFGGDVSVLQSGPESIQPGQTFMIELEINKADREGFAKWQQKLPPGFVASPIETEGATFSFKNQDLKLIWMALPKKETLTIFYEVTADPDFNQDLVLDGKFSFIEENERKDVDANQLIIPLGTAQGDEEVVSLASIFEEPSNDSNQSIIEDLSATEDAEPIVELPNLDSAEEDEEEESSTGIPSENIVTNEDGIIIERTVSHLGNAVYQIELLVEKGENSSFGKIEEYLPEDVSASEMESNDAIFSFKDGVVKLLWMTMPSNNKIKVSFQIESHSDLLDQLSVHGMFSYLNDDKSTQLEMTATVFENHFVSPDLPIAAASPDPVARNEESDSSNEASNEINQEEIAAAEEVAEEIVEVPAEPIAEQEEQTEVVEEETINAESIADIPAPETSISYKVQIAAGKNEVRQDYFEKKYAFQQKVNIEQHEGWFKYTVGIFSEYKQARDERNAIWSKDPTLSGAFVTAYNSGVRISVQEALMISQQKWVP